MKKSILMLLVLIGLSLLVASLAFAVDYPASATVPSPIDVDPKMLLVTGDGKSSNNWLDKAEKFTMDFGTLTLNTFPNPAPGGAPFQVFLSDHFYSIDVGLMYGPGTPITQVTVDYNEGNKPFGQTAGGLGTKTTGTFVKKFILPDGSEKSEAIPADLIPGLGKMRLIDVQNEGILLTDISPGWLRIYVGLVTKDPADPVFGSSWPANFEVFSPGDVPGNYTGTLIISST
jgi:hypothetical protein